MIDEGELGLPASAQDAAWNEMTIIGSRLWLEVFAHAPVDSLPLLLWYRL